MPKIFAVSIALFLLLSAGYAIAQAARSIPWDCSDWQPYAHADRTTAILESLAENRGKTLYCGLDQSDTFSKAETWAAGKDRNERDDTVYFGERGQFRGFIAAQEGWLTDGESGITGQSIATIFEFPKEERRRSKRVKRFPIASAGNCPDPHPGEAGDPQPGTLICSDWSAFPTTQSATADLARREGKALQVNGMDGGSRMPGSPSWTVVWQTFPTTAYWQEKAESAAQNACRARGAQSAINVVFGAGHNVNQGSGNPDFNRGAGLGWFFRDDPNQNFLNYAARQSRTWRATCKKVIRRSR